MARDCSHSPWPQDLSRSASLWCRDRSGQRHAPSAAFMTSWEERFSQQDSQYSTSMLRDIERGGQTEVEHILGFVLNKAVKAQIPAAVARLRQRQGFRATTGRRPRPRVTQPVAFPISASLPLQRCLLAQCLVF